MQHQLAIITGAGSGLGRAYAIDLAAEGFCKRFLINDADEKGAEDTCLYLNVNFPGTIAVANGDRISGKWIKMDKKEQEELGLGSSKFDSRPLLRRLRQEMNSSEIQVDKYDTVTIGEKLVLECWKHFGPFNYTNNCQTKKGSQSTSSSISQQPTGPSNCELNSSISSSSSSSSSMPGFPTILINNAGMLRDISFLQQSDNDWYSIFDVHLHGPRSILKAVFPIMSTLTGGGRIVNVSSTNGVMGAFGQSNYACAKAGVLGLTKSLAREGERNNVLCNVIIPSAYSQMTKTLGIFGLAIRAGHPSYVAPMVTWLCHPQLPKSINGRFLEAGPGFYSEIKFRRGEGLFKEIHLRKPIGSSRYGEENTNLSDKEGRIRYSEIRDYIMKIDKENDIRKGGYPKKWDESSYDPEIDFDLHTGGPRPFRKALEKMSVAEHYFLTENLKSKL